MNASNQDKSERKTIYDPNAALEFFKLFGKLESVKEGKQFFTQGQQAGLLSFLQTDKMYLLVNGQVTIQTAFGHIIHIEPGEIFGEFTHYTMNNSTATANSACSVLSLSEKQLLAGLKKKPEFLFMLMDVLVRYLQQTGTEDAPLTENKSTKKDGALNSDMLNELKQKLGDTALTVIPENRVVFHEGAAALVMYVVLEGSLVIVVDNKIVGRSGPGDIVGEIALVAQQHSRTASVVAETRCVLLAINRPALVELIQTLPSFGISLLRVLASRSRVHRTTAK